MTHQDKFAGVAGSDLGKITIQQAYFSPVAAQAEVSRLGWSLLRIVQIINASMDRAGAWPLTAKAAPLDPRAWARGGETRT